MNYEYHPLANIFPLIEGQAFDDLVADIRTNGVREPIWMYQHQILDGRNRYRAAKEAGVKCELRTYDGDDPVGFVVSLNLHRRHLTESQRAMVAAKLANMPHGGAQYRSANLQNGAGSEAQGKASANLQTPPVSQSDAAKLLSVSTRTVAAAAKVQDEAIPELAHAVERGDVSVSAAAAVAAMPAEQQAEIVAAGHDAIRMAAKAKRAHGKPQTGPKADAMRQELKEASERGASVICTSGRLLLAAIEETESLTQEERDLLSQIAAAISNHNSMECF